MNRSEVRVFGHTTAKVTADTVPWGDAASVAEHKTVAHIPDDIIAAVAGGLFPALDPDSKPDPVGLTC